MEGYTPFPTQTDERSVGTFSFKKSKHYCELKYLNMRFVLFPLPGTMNFFGDR
jgi:hypothetical protein